MKKRECIIHIGMHKTGSTSIQASLHQNLDSETFSYLDIGPRNHSVSIVSLFAKKKFLPALKKRGFTKKNMIDFKLSTKDKLINNLIECNDVMIISGESIPALLLNELEEFRDFLYQYFEKITIVAYVRTPKSYIESAFQQRVKGGLNKLDIDTLYPKYRERFEKFDLVFGRENVKLWKFDPKSFSEGNVVMDFCNRLGIEMKSESTIRVNESLSKEALSLLYIYRKYGRGFGVGTNVMRINQKLIATLQNIGKTKIKFSPDMIQPILEQKREEFLWMEKRLGERLNENIDVSLNDIRREEDLLSISDETIQELKMVIGPEYLPTEKKSNRLEEVSNLVNALRIKMAKSINNNLQEDDEMKLVELVQKVQENNSEKLGKMNEKKIALIIKEALSQIKQEIDNTSNDSVRVPKLGNFKIQMVERKKEDEKVMIKRIIFKLV